MPPNPPGPPGRTPRASSAARWLGALVGAASLAVATAAEAQADGAPGAAAQATEAGRVKLQVRMPPDDVAQALRRLKTGDGAVSVDGDKKLVTIVDAASNLSRLAPLFRAIERADADERIWIEPLHGVAPSEVVRRLDELLGPELAPGRGPVGATAAERRARLFADDRGGALVAVGSERAYRRLQGLLRPFREMAGALERKATLFVVPLAHAEAKEVAALLGGLVANPGMEGVRITADEATNSLVISASERDQPALRKLVEALDQPLVQVMLEATLVEVPSASVAGDAGAFEGLGPPPRRFAVGRLVVPVGGPLNEGLRRALEVSSDPAIVARPHLLAKSGETIRLRLGKGGASRPLTALPPAGAPTCAGPETPPGRRFVLSLTPQVGPSGNVRVDVVTATGRAASDDPNRVACTWRTSKFTVVVADHETVVVETLPREREVETSKRLPVLGSVPLLGDLFQTTERRAEQATVFVVLTPHVIRGQQDLRALFERRLRERQEHLDHELLFGAVDRPPPRPSARSRGLLEEIRRSQRREAR